MPPFKPFASQAQERMMNSAGKPASMSAADVAGMNAASKGKGLPMRVGKKKKAKRRATVMVNQKHFA